jgi:hypothetical protein
VATWLAGPLSRFRAIVEGTYPASPVSGRSTTANRFKRSAYRGAPSDLGWPGADFHRRYLVTVAGVRNVAGAAPNHRTGRVLKSVLLELTMGYLVQPDGRVERAGACADEEAATQLGAEDAHELEEALSWPDFWAGTTPAIAQIRLAGDVTASVVVPRARVAVVSRWDLTVDYMPGQSWT